MISSVENNLSHLSNQFRPWIAITNLVIAFLHRCRSRLQTEKYKLADEDATVGLSYIKTMQVWTKALRHPPYYFVREEVKFLHMRSQSRKFMEDFGGAVSDLRVCHEIIKSMGQLYDEESAHLTSLFLIEGCVSSERINVSLQIVMALQKVRDYVPRPHYICVDERISLEKELGLTSASSVPDNAVLLRQKVLSNANIGGVDKWAYENYGVVVVEMGGENRVVVSTGDDEHFFESITDESYMIVSPVKAQAYLDELRKFVSSRGHILNEIRDSKERDEFRDGVDA